MQHVFLHLIITLTITYGDISSKIIVKARKKTETRIAIVNLLSNATFPGISRMLCNSKLHLLMNIL